MAEYVLTRRRPGGTPEALGGGNEWGQRRQDGWQFALLFDTVKEAIEAGPPGLEWASTDSPSVIAAMDNDGTTYVIAPAPKPRF